MRSVAIIGKCSSTRMDAPLTDATWEKWALGWDLLPVHDRFYEIHENWRYFLGNKEDGEAHQRWLMGQKVPVYMRQVEADIPTSVAYPFDEIADLIGRNSRGKDAYIESSIAVMLAHAILEGVKPASGKEKVTRIGIWGVDMAVSSEYGYQRPNCEYLIGFARGMGIKVWVPPQSALLTPAHDVPYGLWQSPERLEQLEAEKAAA
jgi:hypothetical protein